MFPSAALQRLMLLISFPRKTGSIRNLARTTLVHSAHGTHLPPRQPAEHSSAQGTSLPRSDCATLQPPQAACTTLATGQLPCRETPRKGCMCPKPRSGFRRRRSGQQLQHPHGSHWARTTQQSCSRVPDLIPCVRGGREGVVTSMKKFR